MQITYQIENTLFELHIKIQIASHVVISHNDYADYFTFIYVFFHHQVIPKTLLLKFELRSVIVFERALNNIMQFVNVSVCTFKRHRTYKTNECNL